MADACIACGKPIMAVHDESQGISLAMVWVHVSRRANRNHAAIPPSALRDHVRVNRGRR